MEKDVCSMYTSFSGTHKVIRLKLLYKLEKHVEDAFYWSYEISNIVRLTYKVEMVYNRHYQVHRINSIFSSLDTEKDSITLWSVKKCRSY